MRRCRDGLELARGRARVADDVRGLAPASRHGSPPAGQAQPGQADSHSVVRGTAAAHRAAQKRHPVPAGQAGAAAVVRRQRSSRHACRKEATAAEGHTATVRARAPAAGGAEPARTRDGLWYTEEKKRGVFCIGSILCFAPCSCLYISFCSALMLR